MGLKIASDHVYGRKVGNDPWTDEPTMLSPTSPATMESEGRSLASPSQLFARRGRSDQDNRTASRSSLRNGVSRVNLGDAGVSTTVKENHTGFKFPQANTVVNEFPGFIQACQNLEKFLGETFTHEVQKLGSAFVLVKASWEVHDNLFRVRTFFEENVPTLELLLNETKAVKGLKQVKKRRKRHRTLFSRLDDTISETSQETFIAALNVLAQSVKKFTTAIMDFEDYNDEAGLEVLQNFETELRLLSGGLEFFGADGESHGLERFACSRAASAKVYLNDLSEGLTRFQEIGIPYISFTQKRSSRMLLNGATVATFFGGVTATTLQYSFEFTARKREIAMNTLWFVSLVLSISAAITGLLAMTWRLVVFSSPNRELPWYIRFWIRSGYLVLLIASVIAFLAGLVVFVYDQMPKVTSWIVTACTVLCVLGLSVVSGFFLKDSYSYMQVRSELRKDLRPARWSRIYEHEGWWYWLRFHLIDQLRKKRRTLVEQYVFTPKADPEKMEPALGVKDTLRQCLPCFRVKTPQTKTQDSEAAMESAKRRELRKKLSEKCLSAVRRGTRDHADKARQDGTLDLLYKRQIKGLGLNLSAPLNTRVVHLQFSPRGDWLVVCYKYECCVFDVENSFEYHTTLRHLRYNAKQVEWSSSGSQLITRTRTSVKIWTVIEGDFLLQGSITFDPFQKVTDIQWMSDCEFLALVDRWQFFRVNVAENPPVKTKYDPEPGKLLLEIYYLYTLPESEFVVIVGARNIENVEKDKAIDCILVYEMQSDKHELSNQLHHLSRDTRLTPGYSEGRGAIVKRIPLPNEVDSLSFGQYFDGEEKRTRMVISYLDKPPELWSVAFDDNQLHLNLERELIKKLELGEKQDEQAEWGEVYLIGPSQSIVACAEDGMMYFWDTRDSSNEHFHRLKIIADDEQVEKLLLVTWLGSQADVDLPTLATAGKGLSLKIWAPLGSIMDENDEAHGSTADDLTQEHSANLNTPHLIAQHDSSVGKDGEKGTAIHTFTCPTSAVPTRSASELTRSDAPSREVAAGRNITYDVSPDRMTQHGNQLFLSDGSSHLAPGSRYDVAREPTLENAKKIDAERDI